ncbi:MAG: helix-turn-helix transcriptional regulator [Cytophagales bacterium]|nr:helix-turn-helix transcriptional regulator [Cytophagales bacterium]
MKAHFVNSNLAHLRTDLGFTQEELAKILGLKRGKLSSWEEYRASPRIPDLIKLSNFFNLTLDQLIRVDLRSKRKRI